MRTRYFIMAALAIAVAIGAGLSAQGRGGGQGAPQAPQTPQATAPIDLTGYWVSVVTEDWRYRMVTPPKGDVASVPVNAEARKIAESWDPSQDGRCEAYGAAGQEVESRALSGGVGDILML